MALRPCFAETPRAAWWLPHRPSRVQTRPVHNHHSGASSWLLPMSPHGRAQLADHSNSGRGSPGRERSLPPCCLRAGRATERAQVGWRLTREMFAYSLHIGKFCACRQLRRTLPSFEVEQKSQIGEGVQFGTGVIDAMGPIGLLIYTVHAVSRLRPARGNAFSPEVPSIRRFSLEASTREFCR